MSLCIADFAMSNSPIYVVIFTMPEVDFLYSICYLFILFLKLVAAYSHAGNVYTKCIIDIYYNNNN